MASDCQDVREILRGGEIFGGLSDVELEKLVALMTECRVPEDELIVKEGEPADAVFFLLGGQAEVVKRESVSGSDFKLRDLHPGAIIGEVALLDEGLRSASVRATVDCTLMKLHMEDLRLPKEVEQSCMVATRLCLARELTRRFRDINEKTVTALQAQLSEAKARIAMGTLVCTLLMLNSGYVFVLQMATTLSRKSGDTAFVSIPLLLFFAAGTGFAMKRSGYPRAMYGLVTGSWKRSVTESLLFTFPLLALIVLAKYYLIRTEPAMMQDRLFEMGAYFKMSPVKMLIVAGAYGIVAPIQEIIARGAIQSSFQEFLVGRHRKLVAILMANLMFSMSHIHMGIPVVLLVFLPGLFWGWLFSRHGTLIGACLSHVIVGLFAFYVVGFYHLMH